MPDTVRAHAQNSRTSEPDSLARGWKYRYDEGGMEPAYISEQEVLSVLC
jgi:hypothetical protein